ncbi:MAG: NUDIX hydrolase [Candidatus Micrarchaeia archaeon]|jgi:ADP-ribose pyrophosphatase
MKNKPIEIKKFVYKIEKKKLPNGKIVKIEEVQHNGSVVIIAIENKKIILERQFRPVINKWIYELPAGTIKKGETPEECAKRELIEETGYFPKNLKRVFFSYSSPGYSTEIQYFFLATQLKKVKKNLEKYELIKIKKVSLKEILKLIKDGKIKDGKTIQGLLFFKSFISKDYKF